jgi:hypothetical protein
MLSFSIFYDKSQINVSSLLQIKIKSSFYIFLITFIYSKYFPTHIDIVCSQVSKSFVKIINLCSFIFFKTKFLSNLYFWSKPIKLNFDSNEHKFYSLLSNKSQTIFQIIYSVLIMWNEYQMIFVHFIWYFLNINQNLYLWTLSSPSTSGSYFYLKWFDR